MSKPIPEYAGMSCVSFGSSAMFCSSIKRSHLNRQQVVLNRRIQRIKLPLNVDGDARSGDDTAPGADILLSARWIRYRIRVRIRMIRNPLILFAAYNRPLLLVLRFDFSFRQAIHSQIEIGKDSHNNRCQPAQNGIWRIGSG